MIEEVQGARKYMDGAEVGQMEAPGWGPWQEPKEVPHAGWDTARGEGEGGRRAGQGWLLKGHRSHIKGLGVISDFKQSVMWLDLRFTNLSGSALRTVITAGEYMRL